MPQLKARAPLEVTPGHSKSLIFGRPGSGKTWFALSWPSPYYIDTEGGASLGHYMKRLKDSGGVYFGAEDGATDFQAVLDEVKALTSEKHQYRTLVIDSITRLYAMTIGKEQERLGEGKDVFGASKKPAVAYMRRLLNWIGKLDMNVLFVSHQVSEWGLVNGQRTEIGVMADIWDKLSYELHLALRIEHQSRGLRTATVTKSRLTGFPEHDRLTLQDGEKDLGYDEFAERYGRDYIEAAAVPIALATAEQLKEIDRLTGILKLSDAEIEKVLSRANADSYAELSSDQAKKFIGWLTKKLQG